MATTTSGKTGLFAFDPVRCNAMSDGGTEGNGGAMAGLLRGYFHDDAVRGGSRLPKRQTILLGR